MTSIFQSFHRPGPFPSPFGRVTLQDAHSRLDLIEVQFQALADAVQKATTGQTELAKTVSELTGAVDTLRSTTASTQESLKTFITNSDAGREVIAKLLNDIIDKKTGSWVRYAGIAAICSVPTWWGRLFDILKNGMFHG